MAKNSKNNLRIAEILRIKGWTLSDLAKRMAELNPNGRLLTTATLSARINGNPSLSNLYELADGLGVKITELFPKEDQVEKPRFRRFSLDESTVFHSSDILGTPLEKTSSSSSPSSSTSPQGEQGDIIAEGDPFRSKIDMHVARMDFSQDPTPSPDVMQTTTFCPHCGKRVRVGVVLMAE